MTSKLLLLCAGQRDLRELAASGINAAHMIFHHEYATAALEDLVAPGATNGGAIRDPRAEIADIVATYRGCALNGVISTDDYPGSTLASIVARVLNLPGVDPAADLLCQHKYYSRCLQAKAVPETVPWFARIGTDQKAPAPAGIRYPAFVKPVKSFFSIGASRVDSPDQLAQAIHDNPVSSQFLEPFDTLLQQHLSLAVGAPLIVEDYLPGIQVSRRDPGHRRRLPVLDNAGRQQLPVRSRQYRRRRSPAHSVDLCRLPEKPAIQIRTGASASKRNGSAP